VGLLPKKGKKKKKSTANPGGGSGATKSGIERLKKNLSNVKVEKNDCLCLLKKKLIKIRQ